MNRRNGGLVLVTGGAGYIGSHVVLALREAGWQPVVVDDLSTGRRHAVPEDICLEIGDIADRRFVTDLMQRHRIRSVVHLAGSVSVPESVRSPLAYYANNTNGSLVLLSASIANNVEYFIFSSTAAVYGEPESIPVSEEAPTRPLNPYGRSKLMTEWMLRDAEAAHGLRHVSLRYFNVAGADPQGRAGFPGEESNHLIKVACEVALGRRQTLPIYGTDYATRDGTCVRDFIHVTDIASAHVAALRHLNRNGASLTLNCGYGRGVSVREVVQTTEALIGKPLSVTPAPRRAGDAAEVIADARRIRRELQWRPVFDDLTTIIRHSLACESSTSAQGAFTSGAATGSPPPRSST
jgi:UDP-glucose 4-epimerase